MAITLYDDQVYLIQQTLYLTQNATNKEHTLITSPSASGKTYIIAGLVQKLIEQGHKSENILVLTPTREITEQIDNRLKEALNTDPHAVAISGSVSALNTIKETSKTFSVIIIDEAHHTEADTYKEVITLNPDALVIGLTATPVRNDDRSLADTYKHIVSGLSVKELIKAGRLSEFDYYVPDHKNNTAFTSQYLTVDDKHYSSVKNQQKLERITYGDIVNTWLEKADNRQTIVFTTSIEESRQLAELFKVYGVRAEHVDGSQMPEDDRVDVIKQFRNGYITVLCNQGLVSEGFDVPNVSCVVLARPTRSVILHLQQCFRAMRVGKDPNQKALIIDHANNISRFGTLDADRGWSLTMEKASNAIKTINNPNGNTSTQPRDLDYEHLNDVDLIELAGVTNPDFDRAVEEALLLEGMASFNAFVTIQRTYNIRIGKDKSWAYAMAEHHGKLHVDI